MGDDEKEMYQYPHSKWERRQNNCDTTKSSSSSFSSTRPATSLSDNCVNEFKNSRYTSEMKKIMLQKMEHVFPGREFVELQW